MSDSAHPPITRGERKPVSLEPIESFPARWLYQALAHRESFTSVQANPVRVLGRRNRSVWLPRLGIHPFKQDLHGNHLHSLQAHQILGTCVRWRTSSQVVFPLRPVLPLREVIEFSEIV